MRVGATLAAFAAGAAILAGPSAAQSDRPLAKRTFTPLTFVDGDGCNDAAVERVRLPRRAQMVRVLRPRVGQLFRDSVSRDPVATLTGIQVSQRSVSLHFLGDRSCDPNGDHQEWWSLRLEPVVRYQRRERIFVTSNDGVARVRPRTMYVGASQRFLDLRWRGWGQRVARARGTFPANDCVPYCAKGTITNRPMSVALSRPRMCASRLQYMRVTYRVAGGPHQWFSTRYVC